MKCPKCGADNPESAQFCTLCMEKIESPGAAFSSSMPVDTAGGGYHAPGEWRGDEDIRPRVSEAVTHKLRRFRLKMIVYTAILAAMVAWLVLSLTVWGNPSAGRRSMQLIDAVNDRDAEAFVELFEDQNRPAAEDIYNRTVAYLGSGGRYEDVKLFVDRQNNYDAFSHIESATIRTGAGTVREVTRSDNLMIVLENHKGRWYIAPRGTDIIP